MVVAAYVEYVGEIYAKPTIKQRLAAIRMCFDWLVVGQILPMNPASSIRGTTHGVRRGKTSVLTAEDARQLLDSIPLGSFSRWLKYLNLKLACPTGKSFKRHWSQRHWTFRQLVRPNVGPTAVVLFKHGNDGTYLVADKALNSVGKKRYYDSVRAQLQVIGVKYVSCGMLRVERNYEVIVETIDFNELGK